MIIVGWISSVLGAILSFIGTVLYQNAKSRAYGLYQYYDSREINTASSLLAIGIILLLLGIIFLIIGYLNKRNKEKNEVNLLNTCLCLKCGNITDTSKAFCTRCGNDLNAQKNHSQNEQV